MLPTCLLRAIVVLLVLLLAHCSAISTARLPSYPLAVKSPYLSAWLPGDQIQSVATAQAQFWQGQNLTWSILARLDNKTYALFGLPSAFHGIESAETLSVSYSSSHTNFTLQVANTTFVLDFFSPIAPGKDEYAEHSLPYSYLTVSAFSSKSTEIQILSAIDQSWTGQQGAAQLNYTSEGSSAYFQFYNVDEIPFTENNEMATWGSVIFSTSISINSTAACDTLDAIYGSFLKEAAVTGTQNCAGSDLVAFTQDLGSVLGTASATFVVGFERPWAINYLGVPQTGFHRTRWPEISEAVSYVLATYAARLTASLALDSEIRSRAEATSSEFGQKYADIVEASIRQAFGSFELTTNEANAGISSRNIGDLSPLQTRLTASASPPWLFLKEISSDGNLNTVDLMYQSWPIFISLNPEYIKLFWQPIVPYLESGRWPHPWMIHDMGTHYPNATGHDDGDAEQMPLFETSALFTLLYAYQKFSGDAEYSQQHFTLLDGYAQYLVQNSLYTSSQLTSVDAIRASPNQTSLTIQCAIALNAASVILSNEIYRDVAISIADAIYLDALGLDGATLAESTHFTYNYGLNETWNVIFASYADVLLELQTFPKSAWELQSSWYAAQMQPGGLPFAGPSTYLSYIDGNLTWGLTDWKIMAASVSSSGVQEAIVNTTWAFMTNGLNTIPFGTKYDVEGTDIGLWVGNKARSTVGAHFAILALQQGTW